LNLAIIAVRGILMLEFFKQIVTSQFEAALAMLNQCIAACPAEYWEGKIANDSFRYVAYHTLFFTKHCPGSAAAGGNRRQGAEALSKRYVLSARESGAQNVSEFPFTRISSSGIAGS
jgi:hypothetical protein